MADEIEQAVQSEPSNHNPQAGPKADYREACERREEDCLHEDLGPDAAHHREEDVVGTDHDQDDGVEGLGAIEADRVCEERHAQSQKNPNRPGHHWSLDEYFKSRERVRCAARKLTPPATCDRFAPPRDSAAWITRKTCWPGVPRSDDVQ